MARTARIVIPGLAHHITQRGNDRQDVFFTDDDRRMYLEFLRQQCKLCGVKVVAYCLMTNHVHLIAVPEQQDSLSKAMGRMNFRYAQYVNSMHDRSGHLWQNRFYSCPLDSEHLSGIVSKAWEFPWSSAAAHVGGKDQSGLLDLSRWAKRHSPEDWRRRLSLPEDDEFTASIRNVTYRGRPLGSDKFLSEMETLTGRRLRVSPSGRPHGRKV